MNNFVYFVRRDVPGEAPYLKGFSKRGVAEWTYDIMEANRYPAYFKHIVARVALQLGSGVDIYTVEDIGDVDIEDQVASFYILKKGEHYLAAFNGYTGEPVNSRDLSQAVLYHKEHKSMAESYGRLNDYSLSACIFCPLLEEDAV